MCCALALGALPCALTAAGKVVQYRYDAAPPTPFVRFFAPFLCASQAILHSTAARCCALLREVPPSRRVNGKEQDLVTQSR